MGESAKAAIKPHGWGLGLLVSLGALATPALAQETTRSDEIIVTAQKRAERLVDVPISVNVVGGETLEGLNMNQATDLGYIVPNISFSDESGQRAFSFFIRGIGTTSYASESIESSSAFAVDGVVYGQGGASMMDLPDIERIEVLRGPQGTLWGKNASAGVINVVTRSPAEEFEAGVRLSFAQPENEQKYYAYVTGPISESAGFFLSARLNQREGYVDNLFDDRMLNDRNDYGARARFEFGMGTPMHVTVIGDYWRDDSECCTWTPVRGSTPPSFVEQLMLNQGAVFGVDPEHQVQNQNGPLWQDIENYGLSVQVDADLGGGHTLTSITAARVWNAFDGVDSDSMPFDIFSRDFGDMEQSQFSQELRITSPQDQLIDYVAGFYFFTQDVYTYSEQLLDYPDLGFHVRRLVDVWGNTRNAALFGQANINLSEDFRLIAGARILYQWDEAAVERNFLLPDTSPHEFNRRERSYAGYVWRLGVQHDLSDTSNVFAAVTRGFKGGGFNVTIDQSILDPVDPEIPTNWEIGYRGAFPQHRFSFNATAFYQPVTDFQVYTIFTEPAPNPNDPPLLRSAITNAAEADLRGVELDLAWQPLESVDWTLIAAYGYLDATYAEYDAAPCFTGDVPGVGICRPDGSMHYSGRDLANAPAHSANFISQLELPIMNALSLTFDLNANYRSSRYTGTPQRDEVRRPALTLVNGSVGVGDQQDNWRLRLFVQNMFDEHYATRTFSAFLGFDPSTGGQDADAFAQYGWVPYEAQRITGISLDYRW